jgi:ferrous iron transport protein A
VDQKPVKLSTLKKGDSCIIQSFTNEDLQLKLMEMGCLPGEKVVIDRLAPLGDPMAISVSGYTLCIRLDEAASVLVTDINE